MTNPYFGETSMKRIITAILFFSFFIPSLSAQELTGTLQQIKTSGKIKVGYRQFYPPLSFLDENGVPAGYSIDICEEIISGIQKKIGQTIDIEYIPVTSEGRFSALVDKKIDILCGATTKTLSRSEIVDFTQIIFVTGASFMTRAGNDIRGNFAGKKIGVIKDTTTEIELKKLFEETKIDTKTVFVRSTLEGRKALEKGNSALLSNMSNEMFPVAERAQASFQPFFFSLSLNPSSSKMILVGPVILHLQVLQRPFLQL